MPSLVRETPGPPPLVVAVRVLLVVLAAAAVVAATVVARSGGASGPPRFACPMHSQVTAAEPGDCPICGMALERVDAASSPAAPRAATGDADTIALAAVRSSPEAIGLLRFSVAPARRDVIPGEVYAPATVRQDGGIDAQLYRDQVASLAADEAGALILAGAPGAPIKIRRDPDLPVTTLSDDALARVGFRREPGGAALAPGQIGWVKLAYKIRSMLVVRSTAIINAPDGRYVLVFSAGRGQLSKRRVEVGEDHAGMTAIVSGLRDKEFVVMANTFALDAERRLKTP